MPRGGAFESGQKGPRSSCEERRIRPGFLSGLRPLIAACRKPSFKRCRYSTSTTRLGRTQWGGASGTFLKSSRRSGTPGNVRSAEQWEEVLLSEIERQQQQGKDVVVRADTAFAKPELYEALEKRNVRYAIRIPSNDILERAVAELLTRSVGRPSHTPVIRYKSLRYQAASWTSARRVIAKIEFHCGELFPRVGFIVTTLAMDSRGVVRFYNKRGTAEQWIKEGKLAVKMTRLSCHRFRANEVRLWLSVIAYNLGNLWRRLGLPKRIDTWSLTTLQQRLMKTGGRLVKHARYYWLLLAEGHLTRTLFGAILRRLVVLPGPAG